MWGGQLIAAFSFIFAGLLSIQTAPAFSQKTSAAREFLPAFGDTDELNRFWIGQAVADIDRQRIKNQQVGFKRNGLYARLGVRFENQRSGLVMVSLHGVGKPEKIVLITARYDDLQVFEEFKKRTVGVTSMRAITVDQQFAFQDFLIGRPWLDTGVWQVGGDVTLLCTKRDVVYLYESAKVPKNYGSDGFASEWRTKITLLDRTWANDQIKQVAKIRGVTNKQDPLCE
jgi:hypothetical protein